MTYNDNPIPPIGHDHENIHLSHTLREMVDRVKEAKRVSYRDGQLTRLCNLVEILKMEDEVLHIKSLEITDLTRQVLIASTSPFPTYPGRGDIPFPTNETIEDMTFTFPLLASPLLDILSLQERTDLENSIFLYAAEILHLYNARHINTLPKSFGSLKAILRFPSLVARFISSIHQYTSLLVLWAIQNDISLLSLYSAKHFNEFNYSGAMTHTHALNKHLSKIGIDTELFWQLTKETPDIPASDLVGILLPY